MREGFVKIATVSEVPPNRSKRVRVGDDDIALWNAQGTYYAISNVCAHQHAPALHSGILNGLTVTCPMHGWTYSLETGKSVAGDGRVRTFAVVLEGEDILIERPGKGEESWW